MTRPTDEAHIRDVRIHTVSGTYIPCCERGETDCPCVCHDTPQDTTARSST